MGLWFSNFAAAFGSFAHLPFPLRAITGDPNKASILFHPRFYVLFFIDPGRPFSKMRNYPSPPSGTFYECKLKQTPPPGPQAGLMK